VRGGNRAYLYPVDHLRAFAVIMVVLYHSTQILRPVATGEAPGSGPDWLYSRNPLATFVFEGHSGVALFMVLSGFIFTIGTLGREITYRPFLRNRLLRIYPLYLLLLLVGTSALSSGFDVMMFLRGLLPISNFGPIASGGVWGMMFWAVAVEMQFYLIFPFLIKMLNRNGPRALLAIIGIMVVLRVLAVLSNPAGVDVNGLTYYSLVGRLDQFLLGMLTAWVYTHHRSRLGWPLLAIAALLVPTMLWVFNQLHGYTSGAAWRTVWPDMEGAVWAGFIGAYVAVFERSRSRLSRVLAGLGEFTYSIYLLHFVVITVVVTHPQLLIGLGGGVASAFLTGLLVVLPLVIAISWLSFRAIERPFLDLRGQYVAVASAPTGQSDRNA
jgi:peptidoglycan/LPS O-acetylase OafA/YrhL